MTIRKVFLNQKQYCLLFYIDLSRPEVGNKDDHLESAEKKPPERTGADKGGHRHCSDYGAYIFAA